MPIRSCPPAPGRCRRRRRQVAAAAAAAAAAVLSGCGTAHSSADTAIPTAATSHPAVAGTSALPDCLTGAPVACYTPGQFRTAYGITQLLGRGIDGRGETVVLPEAVPVPGPGNSDIRQDLALFDRQFGLPAAQLKVSTRLASTASPYLAGKEELGDAEMVHAVAPGAAIAIVLVPQGQVSADFTQLLHLAATLGSVVSLSLGVGEHCVTPAGVSALNSGLQADRNLNVTVIASSGDTGAASIPCSGNDTAPAPREGVNIPASDPLVLAVGGTSLRASRPAGAYQGETAWNTPIPAAVERLLPVDQEPAVASGGGFSSVFARPSYQAGVAGIGTTRGVPDVAADAGSATGMAGVQDVGGKAMTAPLDGTSAGAPFWAGIIALADQYSGRHLGFVNPAIYRIGGSAAYHRAFHDVTTGTNAVTYPAGAVTGYRAGPGWDPVTGWGSPDAQVLVPLLAAGG